MKLQNKAGLSLIEILVALGLVFVLMNSVIRIVMTKVSAVRAMKDFSSLQENAHAALEELTEALRSAGHCRGAKGNSFETAGGLSVSGAGGCNSERVLGASNYLRGFEGKDSVGSVASLPDGCIPSDHYSPGNDILVVRYAAQDAASTDSLDISTIYCPSHGNQGAREAERVKRSNIASSDYPAEGTRPDNFYYKTEMYFVRPCSVLSRSECKDGLATLVRYTLEGSKWIKEEIAEGVEQFQLEYGVDSVGEDDVADSYLTADNVADWNIVVSARFSIVVRSKSRDAAEADTNTYNLAGGYEYTPDDEVANHARKAFTRVVQLRKMSRG